MQIVIRQVSGLGNQLFQYAAGRYYAKRYAASMRLALDLPRHANSHGAPRPFLLSEFTIDTPMHPLTILDRIFVGQRRSLKGPRALVNRALGIQVFIEPEAQRYRFLKDLEIAKGVHSLYLIGYWQTSRLVEEMKDELRIALQFKHEPTGKNLEILNVIRACDNPVSLHIRRGDYTLEVEGNLALPVDYYIRALDCMRSRLGNPVFFIFSDDIEFARLHMPADLPVVFVDHNDDMTSHEDLRLMSACHHHIIANSTFSWWGSWLNPRPDKIVIAPKYWLKTVDSYYPDLLPCQWILLPN